MVLLDFYLYYLASPTICPCYPKNVYVLRAPMPMQVGVRLYGPHGTDPPYPHYVIRTTFFFFVLIPPLFIELCHRRPLSVTEIVRRSQTASPSPLARSTVSPTVQSPRTNISRTTSLPKKCSVPFPISTRQGQCKDAPSFLTRSSTAR